LNKIEVAVLNPSAVTDSLKMMQAAARLTQRGETIQNLADFKRLYDREISSCLIENLSELPHPTIQKFGVINVVVVGASRRFLAQITRHQNEVKFMSASLQYSDYSDEAAFAVPYRVAADGQIERYRQICAESLKVYQDLAKIVGNDAAGYAMPQGLRNVLIISATPYQWKHMIGQRTCRRNTDETRIVMLMIWSKLMRYSPELFSAKTTGPFCLRGVCQEGRMHCKEGPILITDPKEILKADYPLLYNKAAWL
jgi:thymidylate synthase (FAD)